MNQKGFTNIILVIVIVILVGTMSYFIFVKKSEPITQQQTLTSTQTTTPTEIPVSSTSTLKDETANWKTYRNEKYGIEFKYPSDIQVKEQKSGILLYPYDALEIALQRAEQDAYLPFFIILGIADDASIAAHKPPKCAETEFCIFVQLEPLACERYYKNQQPGTYSNTSDGGQFSYMVFTVANKQACSENTWRFLGESDSNKEVVFYGPNNTRFQFIAFLGSGVNRSAILKATDNDLKKLEQDKVIYAGSYDTVQLMNKILSTFRFTK